MADGDGSGGDGSGRPVALRTVHRAPRRVRLRPEQLQSREALVELIDRLAEVPGVARAPGRPGTGSVILETDRPVAGVLAAVAEAGIARVLPPAPPPPLRRTAQFGFLRLDAEVQRRTEGSLDLGAALAVGLIALAGVQAARGRLAGPATTLLATAFALLGRRDPG